MDPASFTGQSPGRLTLTPEGVHAFVPDPIPDTLELDLATVTLLARAEHALGFLNGSTGRLLNPYLVASPLLHREAILSSRIEGTITTPEELVLFEVGRPVEPRSPGGEADTREVRNYVLAMRHGLRRLQELPMCLRLVRELHGVLLKEVRGDRERPGEFRTIQNYIGARPSDSIQDARYVPPPVADMLVALRDFESGLHPGSGDRASLPMLVHLALVHYQFEAIHPFRDGNGRVGRLLIPLMLCARAKLNEPLLYLSSYFESHRQQYYDLLLSVSQTGDWGSWVRFFLRGVLECSNEAAKQVASLLSMRERYHEQFQSARSSALSIKLIDELFKRPAITIKETASLLEVTHASAAYNLRKLASAGIVREWTGRRRDQIFVASEILRFMQEDDEGG